MIRRPVLALALALALLLPVGPTLATEAAEAPVYSRMVIKAAFSCDGRHLCRQMRSCEEAYFFLNVCGVHRLDGDSDGVPCETICGSR